MLQEAWHLAWIGRVASGPRNEECNRFKVPSAEKTIGMVSFKYSNHRINIAREYPS